MLQVRAARRAAAQQYLASIQQAAAHQDIQQLLKHLAAARHAASSSSSSSADLSLPPSPSLLADAAAVAVRQLAAASGRPEHAQAFVELALEKQLLEPHQAQRALHAVLQAYADRGDHNGVRRQDVCLTLFVCVYISVLGLPACFGVCVGCGSCCVVLLHRLPVICASINYTCACAADCAAASLHEHHYSMLN